MFPVAQDREEAVQDKGHVVQDGGHVEDTLYQDASHPRD